MKLKNLILSNKSEIQANAYINSNDDLRYKDFRLVLNEKFKNIKNSIIKVVEKKDENEQEELEIEEEIETLLENNNNEEEEEEENNNEDISKFYVTKPPQKSIIFYCIFFLISFQDENLDFSIIVN